MSILGLDQYCKKLNYSVSVPILHQIWKKIIRRFYKATYQEMAFHHLHTYNSTCMIDDSYRRT